MDIYCKTCGEPWDMDTLHDEISERIVMGTLDPLPDRGDKFHGEQYEAYRKVYDAHYTAVREDFYRRGCKAMYAFTGGTADWCQPRISGQTMAMSAAIDLMGDDIDGVASMLDDADSMGMLT